jgi:hypothetical protein
MEWRLATQVEVFKCPTKWFHGPQMDNVFGVPTCWVTPHSPSSACPDPSFSPERGIKLMELSQAAGSEVWMLRSPGLFS